MVLCVTIPFWAQNTSFSFLAFPRPCALCQDLLMQHSGKSFSGLWSLLVSILLERALGSHRPTLCLL